MTAEVIEKYRSVVTLQGLPEQVYNINHGHNPEIQRKCETLNSYSLLIDKIREHQKTELSLAKSIESAEKYCVGNNILEDFLKEHGSMISDILFQEYNLDDHLAARYQDGVEDGIELGEQKNQKYVLELIDQGLSAEEIKQRLKS